MTEQSTLDGNRLPTHGFIDHPSEVVLHVRARTFAELAEEAVIALGSLMEPGMEVTGESCRSEFPVEGIDRGAILVNLLNEVVSRSETEHFIPTNAAARLTNASRLEVGITAKIVSESPSLVKAATFHNLAVVDRNGVVEAFVTLDI